MCENYFNIDNSTLHCFQKFIKRNWRDMKNKHHQRVTLFFFVCLPTCMYVVYSVFVNCTCCHCCIIEAFKDQLAQTVNDQKFMYTLSLTNSVILCLRAWLYCKCTFTIRFSCPNLSRNLLCSKGARK